MVTKFSYLYDSEPKKTKKSDNESKYTQITTKYSYKLHNSLKFWLDILIKDLKSNDDALIIIVAPEGAGKTVFASQICDYMASKLKVNYNNDNVHFDGQSYINKSLDSSQFNINHLDESRRALNKMRAISGGNVEFMNFLSECRSQNQVHVIVLPAFTDLEQYVAIHRVKLLLSLEKKRHPITHELIRGTFKAHITKSKQNLKHQWDKKYSEFSRNLTAFTGKFDNVFCLDEKIYNEKKEQAKKDRYMDEDTKKPDKIEKPKKVSKEELIMKFKRKGLTNKEIYLEMQKKGMQTTLGYIQKY